MYTPDEKRWLLALARNSIYHYLKTRQELIEKPEGFPSAFLKKRGTFVTLNRDKALRGCIGNIEPIHPLYIGVMNNAISAAFKDPRFVPLIEDEFSEVEIEISILSEPQPLEYKEGEELIKKLNPDKDGVIIRHEGYSATFLPQVWEQIKRPEDFLSHLCAKAGLLPNTWKDGDLKVDIYSVENFDEEHIAVLAG